MTIENNESLLLADEDTAANEKNDLLASKFTDLNTPSYVVEFDPDEADLAGCFVEDALSDDDAAESVFD